MKFFRLTLLTFVIFSFGCVQDQGLSIADTMDKSEAMSTAMQSAVFAGGCFWCTEADFEKVPGVEEAISGYTGGKEPNPTYEEVSAHKTGHVEAVRVKYDPTRVSYAQLVEWFWRHVDPTDPGGQFVDRGAQYRSVIFYANEEQREIAEASKKRLASSGRFKEPIVTEILPLGEFYVAEDYHQNYYDNNPIRYNWYRHGSGRDQFLEKHWEEDDLKWPAIEKDFPALIPGMAMDSGMGNMNSGDTGMKSGHGMKKERTYMIPEQEKLQEKLTPLQYEVTQKDGTEPAFNNKYWDNKKPGIYVDVVSGEPLFSSTDKYESGTGWPSFTKPLEEGNIVTKKDRSFFMVRTEVRSKHADSHLGHVFEDGPAPTGLRYCMNSAALRFIPKADLEKEGYGEYLELFKD